MVIFMYYPIVPQVIQFELVFQVRHLRFEEEVEKRRVLEDALHVLATEHHALECSIGAHEVRKTISTSNFPKSGL